MLQIDCYYILILTEVNVTESEIDLYKIEGYNTWSNTRQKQRGDGLIVITISEYLVVEVKKIFSHFPIMIYVKLNIHSTALHILAAYRPPCKNKLLFIEEPSTVLRVIRNDLIFTGDITIDLYENKLNPSTIRYKTILYERGLQLSIPCSDTMIIYFEL